MSTLPPPPVASKRQHSVSAQGVTWDDPWAWLRDPGYPEVTDPDILAYLHAENDYFHAAMAPHKALTDQLFEEMKGRIKEDDASVPLANGDWLYWSEYRPGTQYRLWHRKKLDGSGAELIYDENVEAEGKDYYRLGAIRISPDGKLLATMVDDDGSERFKLVVRDLATGKDIETITEVGIHDPVWSSDSGGLVFNEVNDQWRSYRARYHRLGDDPAKAVTLYEESDDIAFSVNVDRSTDREWIFISSGHNSSTEVRFVPTSDPTAEPKRLI